MLHWCSLDTVILDMDGTLLDLKFDNQFWRDTLPRHYAKHCQLPLKQARDLLYQQMQSVVGTLDWYSLTYWQRFLHTDVLSLARENKHHIHLRKDAKQFLQYLQSTGKRCILYTNADSDSMLLKLKQVDIMGYFECCISSHMLGYPKEHQQSWHELAAKVPFQCDSTLFIDDTLSVLNQARSYGIGTVVAINQPDTSCAPENRTGFFNITYFRELYAADTK